jgi:hypothetical protein
MSKITTEEIIKILYNWSISIDDQPKGQDLVIKESSFNNIAVDLANLINN